MILNKKWKEYEKKCVPKEAGRNQREQTQQAFYAGAITVLNVVKRIGENDMTEGEGLVILEALHYELEEFCRERT